MCDTPRRRSVRTEEVKDALSQAAWRGQRKEDEIMKDTVERVTVNLSTNRSVTTIKEKVFTLSEWREEAKKRFGKNPDNWRFRCPKCKREWSVAEYAKTKGRDNIESAFQECLYCDWKSYGLLGTMGDGLVVTFEDGSGGEVFNFAEQKKAEE